MYNSGEIMHLLLPESYPHIWGVPNNTETISFEALLHGQLAGCAVLRCAVVLCCAALRCAELYCAELCCAELSCAVLR